MNGWQEKIMIYLNILMIRGWDWQEKLALAVMDRPPTDEEQREIIREYWQQYEKGRFEEFDKFIEYLKEPNKTKSPYRVGIWIERAGLLANKQRLNDMFDIDEQVKTGS